MWRGLACCPVALQPRVVGNRENLHILIGVKKEEREDGRFDTLR